MRFKEKELNVNFYVIDSKQKPLLSGKVCQALELVQRVRKIDVNLEELLDQHPDLHLELCQEPTQSKLTPQQHQ